MTFVVAVVPRSTYHISNSLAYYWYIVGGHVNNEGQKVIVTKQSRYNNKIYVYTKWARMQAVEVIVNQQPKYA